MRATPRAARDAIAGIWTADDGRDWLAVRLTAAPSDGAANAALVKLIAAAFGVRKGDVSLASGAASRTKRLKIKGDPAKLADIVAGYDREST